MLAEASSSTPMQGVHLRALSFGKRSGKRSPETHTLLRGVLRQKQLRNKARVNMLYKANAASLNKFAPSCECQIQGQPFTCLVDTGATISLMSKSTVDHLGLKATPDVVDSAEALSGHLVPLLGKVNPNVKIGSKMLDQLPLYVVEDLVEVQILLGQDAMALLGIVAFDFKKGKLRVYEKLPMPKPKVKRVQQGNRIALQENLIIPAHTVVVCPAVLKARLPR